MSDVIDTLAIEIAANDSFTAVAKPLLSLLERLEDAVNKNTEALGDYEKATEGTAKGTEKVNAAQDKSEKSAKKSTKALQAQEKQVKKNEKAAKNLLQVIGGFTKAIGALGTMIFAGVGLDRLAQEAAKTNKELDVTSKNLGMTSQSLATWRGAAELSGGSAQGLTGYLNNLSAGLTRLTVQGDTSVTQFFNALGINLLDGSQKAKKLEDIMLELADKFSTMDRVKAFGIAQQMGIDEGTFEMLAQGRQSLEEHLQKTAKIYKSNQQDLETARKLIAATSYLNQQFEGLELMVANAAMPVLLKIADVTNAFFEYLQKNENLVKGVFFGIAGALSIALIPTLGKAALAAVRFMLPFLPAILIVGGLAAAIMLLYEDYKTWAEGGKSLFNWEKFAKWLDKATNGTLNLKGAVFALFTGYKDLDSLLEAGKAWLKQMGFITDAGLTLDSFINGIKNVGKAIWDYLIAGLVKVGDLIVAIFNGEWGKAASIGWDLFTHYTPKGFLIGQVVGNVTKAADVAVGDDPNDPNSLTSAVKDEKERVFGKDEEPQNQSQQAFAQNTQKQVSMSSGYDALTDYAIENAQNSPKVEKKTENVAEAESTKINPAPSMAGLGLTLGNTVLNAVEQSTKKIADTQKTDTNRKQQQKKSGAFAGFGADVDSYIKEAAQKYGLDEKMLRGFVKMEGGWTGAVSSTGATGVGQFTYGTWNDLAKTKEGKAIGMTAITKETKGTAQDPRHNKRINTLATALLAKNNAAILEKSGIEITGENLYMAHNMGAGFVKAIYGKGKFSAATRRNIDVNGGKGMSAQEFMLFQKGRYNRHYELANNVKLPVQNTQGSYAKPAEKPQPIQEPLPNKGSVENAFAPNIEHSSLDVFSSKLFERFDKVIDLLTMLRELNFNKPLGGEQMNSIDTQARLQAMKTYSQAQNIYNQRFSEVVINGGVNVNSTASTISGTVADAYTGIHNRVNVMQFNTGFS